MAKHIGSEVIGVGFGFYTSDEVRKVSVKQITVPLVFDGLNQPVPSGLYDPALGPLDKFETCATCGLGFKDCPGHPGHIELSSVVYHPLLFGHMFKTLRYKCFYCHHFRISRIKVQQFITLLRLVRRGKLSDAKQARELMVSMSNGKLFGNDKKPKKKVKRAEGDMEDSDSSGFSDDSESEEEDKADPKAYALEDQLQALYKASLDGDVPTDGHGEAGAHGSEFRQACVRRFYHEFPGARKCANCSAYSPNLRRDGASKIFEMPLSAQQLKRMQAGNKTLRNVLVSSSGSDVVADAERDLDERLAGSGSDSDDEQMAEEERANGPNTKTRLMFPNEVEKHLALLWKNEKELMKELWGTSAMMPAVRNKASASDHSMFFLRTLNVPPSRFRPPTRFGDKTFDHAQNFYYKRILENDAKIRAMMGGSEDAGDDLKNKNLLTTTWLELQNDVNCLQDSTLNAGGAKTGAPAGIRQGLEKKEGLFRRNMMGKRVNYAARSVISPDPFLLTNEIGVPRRFAINLSYPEPVTSFNAHVLRQAVINGPELHPGALFIEDEEGNLTDLKFKTAAERVGLSKTLLTQEASTKTGVMGGNGCKKVLRHLNTGDVMLVNRQPTLHKPSMMAHKVRVIESACGGDGGVQTIRMHYANCNSYNADFDGDEINLHFPQSALARAEGYLIANTDNQYIGPTSGNPLRGLIQDHVISAVKLTSRNTFFNKEQYQQLMYSCLSYFGSDSGVGIGRSCAEIGANERLDTIEPAILKPVPLWTGKQVITSVLNFITRGRPPLNLKSNTKVASTYWGPKESEHFDNYGTVIIRGNELLTGTLDKNQIGASKFGLVHAVYELYGAEHAGQLLSIFGRLFTLHLRGEGFTCGIDDLGLVAAATTQRRANIKDAVVKGVAAAQAFVEEETKGKDYDTALRTRLAKDMGAREKMDSAVKSVLNPSTSEIIAGCLPNGIVKKFPDNCMSLMTLTGAKGSLVNFSQISCLLGQQELEGRRVPMMASGKSLPSFRPYDTAPRAGGYVADRFLTGIRPQEYYFHCMAGREGLVDTAVKTSRSGYLQRCLVKHLEGLSVNYDQTVRDSDGAIVQFHYGEDSVDVTKATYLEQCHFALENYHAMLARLKPAEALTKMDYHRADEYFEMEAPPAGSPKDPILSSLHPSKDFGCVSERFQKLIDDYATTDPQGCFAATAYRPAVLSKEKFLALMKLKYASSVVAPGESVGIVCAQGIGEPSTQMTLNTFHLAGQGGANVTLGIPRLREIIMTASDHISTPVMELPLKVKTQDTALQLASRLNRVALSQFCSTVSVKAYLDVGRATIMNHYKIRVEFHPMNSLVVSAINGLKYADFVKCVDTQLLPRLNALIAREINSKKDGGNVVLTKAKKTEPEQEEQEAPQKRKKDRDEDSDEEEEALPGSERAMKKKQTGVYEEPDEEEEAIINKINQKEKDEEDAEGSEQEEAQRQEQHSSTHTDKSMDVEERRRGVLAKCPFIASVAFGNDQTCVDLVVEVPYGSKRLLMGALAEQACQAAVLRATKDISGSFTVEKKMVLGTAKEWLTQTDGVNLHAVFEHSDLIDVNRIHLNDIAAILKTYGVEAARQSIVNEITSVFGVYGIQVNRRHLSLLADYMTFAGGYKALNRLGISSNTSPFQKISFETSVQFLLDACLSGEAERMVSPSARVVLGREAMCGTGSMECVVPLKY